MTIDEAYEILNRVKESPMFSGQKAGLDDAAETIAEIKDDIQSAHEKQEKKWRKGIANGRKEGTRNGRRSIKSPSEYQISKEFEKHLRYLSKLDSAKQWSENVAKDVDNELDRSKEYIEKCSMRTDVFVEELRQHVCDDIADVTLDGESKQWISTIIGLIISIILLVLYALFAFNVGPFRASLINDAVAGFIAAVASVVTVVVTLFFCALVNRNMIRKYDKSHAIKYSELVRASKDRGPFKKSIMLMSFSEEFEEIRQRDRNFYELVNKILETANETGNRLLENQKEMMDQLGDIKGILQGLSEGKMKPEEGDVWADQNAKDITAEQNIILRWNIYCSALRKEYDDLCNNNRGWFSKAVSGYRDKFLSAAVDCGVNISESTIRSLEERIANVLNPDSELAKREANLLLDEFSRGIHCKNDKFQNALRDYDSALRSEFDYICIDTLERFRTKNYLDRLLAIANEAGVTIRREDFLALQQRIIRVLRPESEPAKRKADEMLDEFIRTYIKTKE